MDSYRRSPDIRGGTNWIQNSSPVNKQGETLETVKPAPPKTKNVLWKAPGPLDPAEMENWFPRKELTEKTVPKVSLLSQLLENITVNDSNPWLEYAKFDVSGNPDQKFIRNISIYFPMTEGELLSKPILVSISRDARISDLTGLSCYKYTLENRKPTLDSSVGNYSLFMCEEDGNVDWDFPALEPSDQVSKYGFSILAVVERSKPEPAALCVTLHLPDGTFSQIEVQRRDITLGELLEKGLERRKNLTNLKYNYGYHLEASDEPGRVELDTCL